MTPPEESVAQRLAHLVDRHAPALVLYARQWCDTPEDVVQESLLKLASERSWPAAEVAWLYRVARNGAISAARSQRRRRQRETASAAREPWFAATDDLLDARAATEALAGLALEEREVIVARLWGELTFEAIAELCGISISTAHRRYEAGLDRLRERLEKPCSKNRPT